jgi:hypothetical protein
MEIPGGLLTSILGIFRVLLAAHGLPRVARAVRERERPGAPLLLARGARSVIAAAALFVIALGEIVGSPALVWFGVAFLAEEIYETGVVILILRWGEARGLV